VLGFANLLADGFSMAAGNYLSTSSEAQLVERVRGMEERHMYGRAFGVEIGFGDVAGRRKCRPSRLPGGAVVAGNCHVGLVVAAELR
jgi:hypothetical protein